MAEAVAQRVRSARCERGQRLHAEFDIGDILVRLDALDFGGGQEIGMGSADDAIVIGRPAGGRVAAHRIVRDVAVVQVGEGRIQIGRGVAGDIGARVEPGCGTHFEPHLEREGDVAEAAARIVAAVDDHHGQRHHMALRPVRLIERVGARVRLEDERAAGALRAGRAGDEDRPTAAVLRDRQTERRLAGHALPLHIAIGRVVLRLLVREDLVRQRRDGDIVAPAQRHLDLADRSIDQDCEAAGGWHAALAGRGFVIRCIVGGASAAGTSLGVGWLVAEERVAFVFDALRAFRDAVERRREKAGEIPARGIVLQQLAGEVGIVRAGPDEIAAERVDEPAADGGSACRSGSGWHQASTSSSISSSSRLPVHAGAMPRRTSFGSGAFGVEGEEPREHFVPEVGRPEQAALVVVVLSSLVSSMKIGRGARGEVVPAIGFEHGAVHGGVELAQALDVGGVLAAGRGSDCRSWSCPRCGRSSVRRG